MKRFVRRVLLGPEDAWGTRAATSPAVLASLAALTLLMHALDLATAVHMTGMHGILVEQNPLARAILFHAGPLGLAAVKLGVVGTGVALFIRLAWEGRVRLARNCLVLSVTLGVLGSVSNLV